MAAKTKVPDGNGAAGAQAVAGDVYVPISCADYEMLEIACMDRYDVELATHDGGTVAGRAVDLAVRSSEEYLVIRREDLTTEEVRVDQIRYMAVFSRPARFDEHTFATRYPCQAGV